MNQEEYRLVRRPTPEEFLRDCSTFEIRSWVVPENPFEMPELPPIPADHVRVMVELEFVTKASNGGSKLIFRYLDRPVGIASRQ